MKKIIKKNGFTKFEFILGLLTILGLSAFGVKGFFDNKKGGDYNAFKKLADGFVMDVSVYKDSDLRPDGMYYLNYLLRHGFDEEVRNPFSSNECDPNESYVNIKNPKKVSLKCDNYLIQGIYQDSYTIYEVSDWQDQEETGEADVLYKYKKEGLLVTNDYLLEEPFILTYNENEGTSFTTIDELFAKKASNITIVSKMFYREKKIVKEYKR